MVKDAKAVAVNPADQPAVSKWRESNKAVRQRIITPFILILIKFFSY